MLEGKNWNEVKISALKDRKERSNVRRNLKEVSVREKFEKRFLEDDMLRNYGGAHTHPTGHTLNYKMASTDI